MNSSRVAEFPEKAKAWLNAFYEAKGVSAGTTRKKIEILRTGFELQDTIITADKSISDDDESELRILEFYVLTKFGLI